MPPVVAEVVRSGFVESRHAGVVAGLDAPGALAVVAGDPEVPVFPRSSSKPLQTVGMLRCGLDRLGLPDELLALVTASHSGEPVHLEGVRRILAGAGLDESALRTPADLPLGEQAQADWLRAGRGRAPLAMNCSGKHAGMLAACVVNDWPLETYREPDHPLQVRLRSAAEDLAGERVAAVGVDGCGAPVFALRLRGLARAFAAVATAPAGSSEHRVAEAMRHHPLHLGGSDRDVTALIRAVPGLIAKDGADGVYAAATPDGRAVALKILDGAGRARMPVLVAALRRLGVDAPGLDALAVLPVLGGGRRVGEVRALL